MKRVLGVFLISLVVFAVSGCGYTTRSTLPANLRSIHILPLKNNIYFTLENSNNIYLPRLEIDVRNKIISRFLFDGALKIRDPEVADLILGGDLVSYEKSELRSNENEDIEEYRVHVTVTLVLTERMTKEVRWTNSIVGEYTYFVTGPKAISEDAAVKKAIEDLARRVVERVVDDW